MAYQTRQRIHRRDRAARRRGRAATAQARTPAIGATAYGAAGSDAAARYSGQPVTFNFQDVPVRTVLQLIAEESNLNIVASDTVQGNVTLRLVNVPWDQALDIVLQAKGLDKRRSGNVVWVAPQTEIAKFEQDKEDARIALENRAEMVTEYIPINYANAEDIAKAADRREQGRPAVAAARAAAGRRQDRGFLSPRGSISFDKRTNTLLVIDIPQRVASIKDLVQHARQAGRPGGDRGPHRDRQRERSRANWAPSSASAAARTTCPTAATWGPTSRIATPSPTRTTRTPSCTPMR